MINKKMLTMFQKDIKLRFRSYKRGMQQGLPMIWDNMMAELKKDALKKIENKD